MRIAVHKSVHLEDGDAVEAIAGVAGEAGFADVGVTSFYSSIGLMDALAPSDDHILDLIVLPYRLPDTTALHAIEEARARLPLLYAVIVDDSPEHAAEAAEASIDGYLVNPLTRTEFAQVMARMLKSIGRLHRASFLMNSTDGEHRVPFHSVVYCETSGHEQVLHLESGSTLTGRYSSQSLFELLEGDGRFFKVGSSYIANLNEVEEANTPAGLVTLSNGTKLAVPHRVRKDLERTILEWS